MIYYHVNPDTQEILAGPVHEQHAYVKQLTSCGNPECLDLSQYNLWPEVREPLTAEQKAGAPVAEDGVVTIPAIAKTSDDLAADLAARRAALICTPRQARLALKQAGLLAVVTAWIATADEQTQIEWEYANEIRRDHAAITGAASALGVTDVQLDALFEVAMQL